MTPSEKKTVDILVNAYHAATKTAKTTKTKKKLQELAAIIESMGGKLK
jgi:hypothetical protein